MKELIKKVKERREGFTMAELLIVVAIIAVLVAIAIPVFNGQLEKSRDAVSVSNIRAAYAESQTAVLTYTADVTTGDVQISATSTSGTATGYIVDVDGVATKGTVASDNFSGLASELSFVDGSTVTLTEPAAGDHTLRFTYNTAGQITALAWDPS